MACGKRTLKGGAFKDITTGWTGHAVSVVSIQGLSKRISKCVDAVKLTSVLFVAEVGYEIVEVIVNV